MSTLGRTRAKIRRRYGADCPDGCNDGIRQVKEITELGERTWYECPRCGVSVNPPCCGDTDEKEGNA